MIWGVSLWYNYQEGNQPVIWGVSWSSKQATKLGLDNENLKELLNEIPFKRLQLMSYWDIAETSNEQL